MGLIVKVPPSAEPVTLAEAREHTSQNTTDQDSQLVAWIAAARERAELETDRAVAAQTFEQTFDCFPADGGPIRLSRPPLFSVVWIKYIDTNGTEQTLAASEHLVSTSREPGEIRPAYGKTWPSTRGQMDAVKVEFVAGWPATDIALGIASGLQTVTPGSMAAIKVGTVLSVDKGAAREMVIVTAATATTFTTTFSRTHEPGAKVTGVPDGIQAAMKLMIGHWNANREETIQGSLTEVPLAAKSLLLGFWSGGY